MRLTTRFFEASGQYRLIAFEVKENEEFSTPDGAIHIHSEPIVEDDAISGFDLWLLVPSDRMAEAVNELTEGGHGQAAEV